MSTRAALFIQADDTSWLAFYCHYDGYPEHMLPALANADPKAILAAREIRQVCADGSIDAFDDPRGPERLERITKPEWAEHAYVLTGDSWQHLSD